MDFKNKLILITGGTGSFGQEFLRTLVKVDFKEIRIFSRDELKQDILRNELNNPKVKFYIGDVRDRDSVDHVMQDVNFVFHAAALKQVPSCEFFPMQALLTNVIGSNNVIEAAVKHKVEKIICLSTDKAVYPVNAMGMTKGLMEKIAHSVAMQVPNDETIISVVRYGNVMCSRGSVISMFIKYIKANKPLPITEPTMKRFLLSLGDAIDLVRFAFENTKQGDTFIKKAPACAIIDLATALKNILKSDVPIERIGLRHGEKMVETLASIEELRSAEDMGGYFRLKMDDRDLNYSKYLTEGDVDEVSLEDYTSQNTRCLSVKEIEEILITLPEIKAEL